MKKTFAIVAIVALCVGPAMADSLVSYTLGLGGDNQVAVYESTPTFPQFDTTTPPYTQGDDYVLDEAVDGSVMTWSVDVEVARTAHTGGDSDGDIPLGLANMVFTLELRDYTGEVEGSLMAVDFLSTINDGDSDGIHGLAYGADPLHWAAFTHIYDIDGNGVTGAPGRLIDDIQDGGPNLDRDQYPSKTGTDNVDEPSAASVPAGTLMGMGAGYSDYVGAGCGDIGGCGSTGSWDFYGVGMDYAGNTSWDGLGIVPVAEGQIDMDGMPAGTYILKLIATNAEAENVGTNILEGDFDPDLGNPGEFASLANTVSEDDIIFEWEPSGVPPVLLSISSVKQHGTAADQTVVVNLAPTTADSYAKEPRNHSSGDRLVIVYNQTVQAADGTLDTEVTVSSGTLSGLSLATTTVTDDTVVATFGASGPTNNACLTIGVSGISSAGGLAAPTTAYLKVVKGEVNDVEPVSILDLSAVKAQLSKPVTALNFRSDVDRNNIVSILDLSAVKSNLNKKAICP